jgi:uncharacterized glyoxalase superfamily protein PhnB
MSTSVKMAVPILPAADVTASLAWWTGVCGFTETFRDSTPPNYVGISRDGVSIHLASITDKSVAKAVGDQTMVRIVVSDVTSFFAEYQQRGGKVHPNGGLSTKPWGTLEFAAHDPNGVCVTFLE